MSAAFWRALNIVRMLRNRGADVNLVDSEGYSAFCYALETQDPDIYEELIPTTIPTGGGLQRIWEHIAQFKPKMSNPFKKFIHLAVSTGLCLEVIFIYVKKSKYLYYGYQENYHFNSISLFGVLCFV